MSNRIIMVKDRNGKYRAASKKERQSILSVIETHALTEDGIRFHGDAKEYRTQLSI